MSTSDAAQSAMQRLHTYVHIIDKMHLGVGVPDVCVLCAHSHLLLNQCPSFIQHAYNPMGRRIAGMLSVLSRIIADKSAKQNKLHHKQKKSTHQTCVPKKLHHSKRSIQTQICHVANGISNFHYFLASGARLLEILHMSTACCFALAILQNPDDTTII